MRRLACVFIVALGLVSIAVGQAPPAAIFEDGGPSFRPLVSVNIAGGSGFGYLNPQLGIGAGLEASGRRWLSLTSFNLDWARKIETGDGFELSSSSLGFVRYKAALAGGGLRWASQHTSRWSKSALRPEIAGGFEWWQVRVIGRYFLPGSDHLNGVRGVGADITYSISRHLRLQGTLEAASFYPTGFPSLPRLRGTSMSFGVTLIK